MNQQNQGSGFSNPGKRKRGRPRKDERVIQAEPLRCVVPESLINPNQPGRTTGSNIVVNPNQLWGTTGSNIVVNPNQVWGTTGSNIAVDPNQPWGTTGSNIVINPNQPAGTTGSSIATNPNQSASTTGNANDEMVGRVVTGVIEGGFGGGYLLKVQIGDPPTYLQGVVFRPGQYVPVTPENDLAPHLGMIQRANFPIPVLNSQSQTQSSIPLSGQGSRQPVELQPPVKDQVLPTEIHPRASSSLQNQSASVQAPMTTIPASDSPMPAGGIPQTSSDPGQGSQSVSVQAPMTNIPASDFPIPAGGVPETSTDPGQGSQAASVQAPMNGIPESDLPISAGGILQTSSDPGQGSQSASVLVPMTNIPASDLPIPAGGIPETFSDPGQGSQSASTTKMECDNISEQDTFRQVKEPGADGGTEKDSRPTTEGTNLLPMTENIDKQLQTGQQHTGSSVQLNEQLQNFPEISNFGLNQLPASAEPEPMQSEQTQDEPMNSNIELNGMPVSAEPQAMQSEQIHEPRNTNLELNEMPGSDDPENVQFVDKPEDKPDSPKPAHGGDNAPSESMFGSDRFDLPEMSDHQNKGSSHSSETAEDDVIQPSGDNKASGT